MSGEERKLSCAFLRNLERKEGILFPLLEYIKKDNSLMLAIRNNYINVYYRGGNILRLTENCNGNLYTAFFDENYASLVSISSVKGLERIDNQVATKKWLDIFPLLKLAMDTYRTANPALEREFQQIVVRENNFSAIANETEYFIADIEAADSEIGARYDMVALKWPAEKRKTGDVDLALVEMKYADDALGGTAGIEKHLQDVKKYLLSPGSLDVLRSGTEEQFNRLNQLGLVAHKKGASRVFKISTEQPELILLLANHNPRSKKLANLFDKIEPFSDEENNPFKLRFFVSSYAGYGMHSHNMLTFKEFCAYQKIFHKSM